MIYLNPTQCVRSKIILDLALQQNSQRPVELQKMWLQPKYLIQLTLGRVKNVLNGRLDFGIKERGAQ